MRAIACTAKRSASPGLDAMCGLVAAGLAVAAGQLASLPLSPSSAPVVAVGSATVELTPAPVTEWAIQVFGTATKTVLLIGVGVLVAVIAAAMGRAARNRPRVPTVAGLVVGVLGAVAAWSRPGAGLLAALPSIVAGIVVAIALRGLLRLSERTLVEESAAGFDRRRFVIVAAATAAASAVGGGFAVRVGGDRAQAAESRAAIELPPVADPAGELSRDVELDVTGLGAYVTPTKRFYRIDTALTVPQVDATTWRLRLHGLGVDEREFTFDDLLQRSDLMERYVTLACVSNPVGGEYVGNAAWIGVPLAAILSEAGARAPSAGGPADQLVARSADGITIGTPVEDVLDGRDAMLALGMNGQPLPTEHGFPVRMVVSGLYGYVSACKWLVDLELTTFDTFDAYWVRRGWAVEAPIKTQARIDTPRTDAVVAGGEVPIAGVAWAQPHGIDRVEVRVDDEPWRDAELAGEHSADTWRQWVYWWRAMPGAHQIQVRATDGRGETQTAQRADPIPGGASGYHEIAVTIT